MNTKKTKPAIVFLGTPALAADILEYILLEQLADVKALWTNPPTRSARGTGSGSALPSASPSPSPSSVALLGRAYNIPLRETVNIDSKEIEYLKHLNVDFGLIVAYGSLLPSKFFEIPSEGMYNVHFSLLPKYRGASPLQAAILSGDAKSGVTIQKITAKLDAGDSLLSKTFSLQNLFYEQALKVALGLSKQLLVHFFSEYKSLPAIRQDELQVSYCYKIKREAGWIGLQDSPEKIQRKLHAYTPWPGVFFYIDEEKYLLWQLQKAEAEVFSFAKESNLERGSLFTWKDQLTTHTQGKKLYLLLQEGAIEILKLQRSGKKALLTKDFLNGMNLSLPRVASLKNS